jgi:hypothetical protein
MAQNIGKRRGKSPIKTRLEMERRAENKNPGSRKAFAKGLGTIAETALNLSAVGPSVRGVGAAVKGYKKLKPSKGYKRVYRGEELDSPYTGTINAEALRGRYFTPNIATARNFASRDGTTTGKVFSLDLPEKQFNIGRKIAQRRKGEKFSDEINVPKLYKDKKKLMEGQTKFVRGRAKAARYLAPGAALAELLEKQLLKGSKKKGGGLTKTVAPKRGPNPQGLKKGGCPHREAGAKSDIQGIKDIQVKGQKFTGVK